MKFESALLYSPIRVPTQWELDNIPRIVLASQEPWDPTVLNDYMPGHVVYPEEMDTRHLHPTSTDKIDLNAQEILSYIHDHRHEAPTQWTDPLPRQLAPVSTKEEELDYAQFIGPPEFVSLDRVKSTFEHTTQLATNWLKLPLQRHFKSRMPQLNRPRLNC